MSEHEEGDSNVVFHIRLLIKHATLDPKLITDTLLLTPHLAGAEGMQRYTPKGRPSGIFRETVWSYSEEHRGHHHFVAELERLVGSIEQHAKFLSEITSSGGTISLLLDLSGADNVGDVIGWPLLTRLASLRIDLGAEVFPGLR